MIGNDALDPKIEILPTDGPDVSSPDGPHAPAVNDFARPVASPNRTSRNTDPMGRAQQALSRGDLAEAESLLQARLNEYPLDANARELLIGLMLRGERHAAALRQLEQGIQTDPDSSKLKLIKAQLLVQMGQPDAARQQLLELLETGAARERVLMMLGAVHQQLQWPGRAEENYRALLKLAPSSGAAWVGLAIALDSQGSSEALGVYRRAMKIGGLPAAAESYARQRIDGLAKAQ
jgi:MSHA biogenesis protein MshN